MLANTIYSPRHGRQSRCHPQLLIATFFITLLVVTICIVFAELSPIVTGQHTYDASYMMPHISQLYTTSNYTRQHLDSKIVIDTTIPQQPCMAVESHNTQPAVQCRNKEHKCFYNFPRYDNHDNQIAIPSRNIWITSVPDHGAGIGHQFGEWLYAPYLSYQYNVSYMFAPFVYNSARWTKFLGWAEGEDTEDDLMQMTKFEHFVKISLAQKSVIQDKVVITEWLDIQLREVQQRFETGVYTPQHVVVLELQQLHVPEHTMSCHPPLNLLLRQKYCLARVRRPVPDDFYLQDQQAGNIVVAVHMRCGDSCYDENRATSLTAVETSIRTIRNALQPKYGDKVAFHLFSQAPLNDTADNHFAPLLTAINDLKVSTHFSASSASTLHHLATSDVLLGAQSSFSWVASLLHQAVTIGPIPSCGFSVPYDRAAGTFDPAVFLQMYEASKHMVPKFRTLDDCDELADSVAV